MRFGHSVPVHIKEPLAWYQVTEMLVDLTQLFLVRCGKHYVDCAVQTYGTRYTVKRLCHHDDGDGNVMVLDHHVQHAIRTSTREQVRTLHVVADEQALGFGWYFHRHEVPTFQNALFRQIEGMTLEILVVDDLVLQRFLVRFRCFPDLVYDV